ncbi:MAG: D-alanyl-D-alanine carboxypeptidase family protein [Proteobacteria bacterium]|nr:D-alanyl-D-alanine carboxypeptidase family protein [Pseudomonadota bacterium]
MSILSDDGRPALQPAPDAVAPFLSMRSSAKGDGIDLMPASSFRDFDRQLAIWNGKRGVSGELLGEDGRSAGSARSTMTRWWMPSRARRCPGPVGITPGHGFRRDRCLRPPCGIPGATGARGMCAG